MNQNNEKLPEKTNPKYEACRANLGRTPTADEFLTWAYARGKEYASETGEEMPTPNQLYTVAPHTFFEAWLTLNAGHAGWDTAGTDATFQRNAFVKANLGLAVSYADNHRRQGMEMDDLMQEGYIGIGIAVDKFEWHRGTTFSTYAMEWIRHNVNRSIENDSSTIKIPVHIRTDARKNPTGESAKLVSVSQPHSLDKPHADTGTPLVDFIVDHNVVSAPDQVDLRIRAEALNKVLAQLTDKEAQVLSLRFGLDDGKSMTLNEIGTLLGTSREYIRQVEAKALRKIRLSEANYKELKQVA